MTRDVFGQPSLEGVVRAGDKRQFAFGTQTYQDVLAEAGPVIRLGVLGLDDFHSTKIRAKPCVSYRQYDVNLALRAITRHLRRRYKLAPPSRDAIVRGLVEALLDATPTYVVRRDIRSFYETVPAWKLRDTLVSDPATPPLVRSYLAQFFSVHCGEPNHIGIPRGTAISPLLADVAMQEFDAAIRSAPGVFRYYRYADDIIALTTRDPADLSALMERHLPEPMEFHRNLKKRTDKELPGKKGHKNPVSLEYLGYRFEVTQTDEKRDSRTLRVAFSDRKIRKLKARVIVAALANKANPNWPLFLDRISFLTSNHRVLRGHVVAAKDSPYVMAGLYYNYRACGHYQVVKGKLRPTTYDLRELKHLDGFYFSILKKAIARDAPPPEVIALLRRRSFASGYSKKIHHKLQPDDIQLVQSCWRHM